MSNSKASRQSLGSHGKRSMLIDSTSTNNAAQSRPNLEKRQSSQTQDFASPTKSVGSIGLTNYLHTSTMSGSASQQNFQAREYKEKHGFVVKKSTKVLTVPASFNLNTDRRL